MQTVYARSGSGGGGGSQKREVADGGDVVFTDTDLGWPKCSYGSGI